MESGRNGQKSRRSEVVFHIRPGEEHSLQISSDILDKRDFMFHSYEMALSALYGIVKYSHDFRQKIRKEKRNDKTSGQEPDIMDLYGYPNNIIAFCAGRGQGKTSAMLSFTKALEKHNTGNLYGAHQERRYKDEAEEEGVSRKGEESETKHRVRLPDDVEFIVLHPIDPTILEDNNYVMEVILSELFSLTEERWNSDIAKSGTRRR